jgi:uncharacterized membrane protein YhaH (DUF805 family)
MNWYTQALKKYATFSGRARRKEYWLFILINLVITAVFVFLDITLGTVEPETGTGILSTFYGLFILLPNFAVLVRRLHDTGRSGWWVFIGLIPIIGYFVLLVFLMQNSEDGENKYGSNPKEVIL